MEYDEAIEYLYNLKIYGMSLGLERITFLLEALGSPHKDIRAVHVAGTNGKGSVCAMVASILQSSGYKVGLFTSPHLVRYEERIQINRVPIPKKELCRLVEKVRPIAEAMARKKGLEHPTFFEITTAIGFCYFKDQHVDYAVLEVGLGGRLDATNIIKPLVSVITTIDFDHMHVLGNTLKEIAFEKFGIIKEGVPVVSGIDQDELIDVQRKICMDRKCKMPLPEDLGTCKLLKLNTEYQEFDLTFPEVTYKKIRIPLLGEHQLKNAQLAVRTAEELKKAGVDIPRKGLYDGMKRTSWPGRFQIMSKKPYIVLDVAHNPAGMKVLARTITEIFPKNHRILVMGIMRDKDIPGIVSEACTFAHRVIVAQPKFERSADPQIIYAEVKRHLNDVVIVSDVAKAVSKGIQSASKNDVVCVSGSVFHVGEAMGVFGSETPRPI